MRRTARARCGAGAVEPGGVEFAGVGGAARRRRCSGCARPTASRCGSRAFQRPDLRRTRAPRGRGRLGRRDPAGRRGALPRHVEEVEALPRGRHRRTAGAGGRSRRHPGARAVRAAAEADRTRTQDLRRVAASVQRIVVRAAARRQSRSRPTRRGRCCTCGLAAGRGEGAAAGNAGGGAAARRADGRRAPLLDPFCGSGTIAIEAALHGAAHRAGPRRDASRRSSWPGLGGAFAAARAEPPPRSSCGRATITGQRPRCRGDRGGAAPMPSGPAWAMTIAFRQAPISDLPRRRRDADGSSPTRRTAHGIGERDALRDLYAAFGRVMRERRPGWRTGDAQRRPDARRADRHRD